jgi:hypothetical protein
LGMWKYSELIRIFVEKRNSYANLSSRKQRN